MVNFRFTFARFGSLLAPSGVVLAPFTFFGRKYCSSCIFVGVFGLHFLTFYVTGLHLYASPYKFLEKSTVLCVRCFEHGARPLSRKRRRSAAPCGAACYTPKLKTLETSLKTQSTVLKNPYSFSSLARRLSRRPLPKVSPFRFGNARLSMLWDFGPTFCRQKDHLKKHTPQNLTTSL